MELIIYCLLSVTDGLVSQVDVTQCMTADEEIVDCPLTQQQLVERVTNAISERPWWFSETGDERIDETAVDASFSCVLDNPTEDDVTLLGKEVGVIYLEDTTTEQEYQEALS